VRWLEIVLLGVYWWHPVLWWARRKLQQSEELCCDARVVSLYPALAKEYARALVEAVRFTSGREVLAPCGAAGPGGADLLKKRIVMILRGVSPRVGWSLRLALGGLACIVLPWSFWSHGSSASPVPLPAETAGVGATDAADRARFVVTRGGREFEMDLPEPFTKDLPGRRKDFPEYRFDMETGTATAVVDGEEKKRQLPWIATTLFSLSGIRGMEIDGEKIRMQGKDDDSFGLFFGDGSRPAEVDSSGAVPAAEGSPGTGRDASSGKYGVRVEGEWLLFEAGGEVIRREKMPPGP
jgi:hypothetical protein